ncbi:hypothetical protein OVA24_18165 [Luteolibacter sp. SL250]|uniref:hypothetical protein n=1 Tax=Luteolibacter sp. SL250 TaxID=2995170 RepID=UPI002271402C|nr:hypothetical protein [Luteolibacter sp. SL250]WAC19155.1 hypothetical protein OVA24_18165 [Luteolibacter sp. SL250]
MLDDADHPLQHAGHTDMPDLHHMTIAGIPGGAVPVAVGVVVMVLQALAFFRDLDERWTWCCLALSPVPLLLGITEFGAGYRQTVSFEPGVAGGQPFRTILMGLEELLFPLAISALTTVLLVAGMVILYLPIRHRRPGTVGIIWTASVAMVFLCFSGEGLLNIRAHSKAVAFHPASPGVYETEGPVTVLHWLLTGHIAGWFIPFWLIVAAVISCRLHPRFRLRLAYVVFGLTMLILITSCLVIFKAIVVINATHPAISGKSWVDVLKVHSW